MRPNRVIITQKDIMKHTFAVIILIAGLVPSAAFASDKNTLCTDTVAQSNRTTLTGSTCTVDKNGKVIESGYKNITNKNGNTSSYPAANIRIGTYVKNLEIDVATPSSVRSGLNRGISNTVFGIKYGIKNSDRFGLAARSNVDLPTSDKTFGNKGISFSGGLVGLFKPFNSLSLSASSDLQANAPTDKKKYGSSREAIAADLSVLKNTHLTAGYALQTNALGPKSDSKPTVQVGVSQNVGQAALDLEVGRDPKRATDYDHYVNAGFTVHF